MQLNITCELGANISAGRMWWNNFVASSGLKDTAQNLSNISFEPHVSVDVTPLGVYHGANLIPGSLTPGIALSDLGVRKIELNKVPAPVLEEALRIVVRKRPLQALTDIELLDINANVHLTSGVLSREQFEEYANHQLEKVRMAVAVNPKCPLNLVASVIAKFVKGDQVYNLQNIRMQNILANALEVLEPHLPQRRIMTLAFLNGLNNRLCNLLLSYLDIQPWRKGSFEEEFNRQISYCRIAQQVADLKTDLRHYTPNIALERYKSGFPGHDSDQGNHPFPGHISFRTFAEVEEGARIIREFNPSQQTEIWGYLNVLAPQRALEIAAKLFNGEEIP